MLSRPKFEEELLDEFLDTDFGPGIDVIVCTDCSGWWYEGDFPDHRPECLKRD